MGPCIWKEQEYIDLKKAAQVFLMNLRLHIQALRWRTTLPSQAFKTILPSEKTREQNPLRFFLLNCGRYILEAFCTQQ